MPLLSVTVCHLAVSSFVVCRSLGSVAPSQHPAPPRTRDFFFAGGGRGNIIYTFGQIHLSALHFISTSKSNTSSFVSSVPFRLPTAHTSFVLEALIRHTTPPLPPLSNVTRFRINSPVFKSQSFTVPSSELVITKFLLNCKQVTAL